LSKNKQDMSAISDQRLQTWIESAYRATELKENVDYVVEKDARGKNIGPVRVVSWSTTGGVADPNCRWSGGLHEFVELKEGLEVGTESATGAILSHAAFFELYSEVLGVTGTMGGTQERAEVLEVYKLHAFDVPPHRPCRREVKPPICILGQENHLLEIKSEVVRMKSENRPVLLICPTIDFARGVSDMLRSNGVAHQMLDDRQAEDEAFVVLCAGRAGTVTVATNKAGRGTDIKPSRDAIEAGGLHVIFAFLPANTRVEEQGIGRAARQGQKGSSRIIVELEHAKNELICEAFVNQLNPQALFEELLQDRCYEGLLHLREAKVATESHRRKIFSELSKKHWVEQQKFFQLRSQVAKWCVSVNFRAKVEGTHEKVANDIETHQQLKDSKIWRFSRRSDDVAKRLPPTSGLTIQAIIQKFPDILLEEWGRFMTLQSRDGP
jgi:preprotein translocase subunit SecA